MILIEAGNTFVKAVQAYSKNNGNLFKVPTDDHDMLSETIKSLPVGERVLLCSVRRDASDVIAVSGNHLQIERITYQNLGAVKLEYRTPETLGIDRVVACLGAAAVTGGIDVIVIDSGTACTIDYMTADFVFRGGVIMPGLPVQQHAMRQILPELPVLKAAIPDLYPGKSSNESVQWGLYGGFLAAIETFIKKYRHESQSASIFTAGGDGCFITEYLERQFGYSVTHKQHLVFDGMRAWMDLNDV